MSKKDYQAIAAAIYTAHRRSGDKAVALQCLTDDLCDIFKADNSAFSRERFREACETGKCRGMRQVA